MQTAISYVLARIAKVADVDSGDVETSIIEGTLRLRHMKLRRETANRILPIPIDSGEIEEVFIKLPWPTSSNPIVAQLRGPTVVLTMDFQSEDAPRTTEEILEKMFEEDILGVDPSSVKRSEPPNGGDADAVFTTPSVVAPSGGDAPSHATEDGEDNIENASDAEMDPAADDDAEYETISESDKDYQSCVSDGDFGDTHSMNSTFTATSSLSLSIPASSFEDDEEAQKSAPTGIFATLKSMAMNSLSWLMARPVRLEMFNVTLKLPCDSGKDVFFEIHLDELIVEIEPTQELEQKQQNAGFPTGSMRTKLKVVKISFLNVDIVARVEDDRQKAISVQQLQISVTQILSARRGTELRKNVAVTFPEMLNVKLDEKCLYAFSRCLVARNIMMQLPRYARPFSDLRRKRSWWPFAKNYVLAEIRDRRMRYNGNLSYLTFYSSARASYLSLLETCIRRGEIESSKLSLAELEMDLRFDDVVQYLRQYARERAHSRRCDPRALKNAGLIISSPTKDKTQKSDGSVESSEQLPDEAKPTEPLTSIHVEVKLIRVKLPARTSILVNDILAISRRTEHAFSISSIVVASADKDDLLVTGDSAMAKVLCGSSPARVASRAAQDASSTSGLVSYVPDGSSQQSSGNADPFLRVHLRHEKSGDILTVRVKPTSLALTSTLILCMLKPAVESVQRIFRHEKLTRLAPASSTSSSSGPGLLATDGKSPQAAPRLFDKMRTLSVAIPAWVVRIDDVTFSLSNLSAAVVQECDKYVPRIALSIADIRVVHGAGESNRTALLGPFNVVTTLQGRVAISAVRVAVTNAFFEYVHTTVQDFKQLFSVLKAESADYEKRYILTPTAPSYAAKETMRRCALAKIPDVDAFASSAVLRCTQCIQVEGFSLSVVPAKMEVAVGAILVEVVALKGKELNMSARVKIASVGVKISYATPYVHHVDLDGGITVVLVSLRSMALSELSAASVQKRKSCENPSSPTKADSSGVDVSSYPQCIAVNVGHVSVYATSTSSSFPASNSTMTVNSEQQAGPSSDSPLPPSMSAVTLRTVEAPLTNNTPLTTTIRHTVVDVDGCSLKVCGAAIRGQVRRLKLFDAVHVTSIQLSYISDTSATQRTDAPYNASYVHAYVLLHRVDMQKLIRINTEHLDRLVNEAVLPFVEAYVPERFIQVFNSGLSDVAAVIATTGSSGSTETESKVSTSGNAPADARQNTYPDDCAVIHVNEQHQLLLRLSFSNTAAGDPTSEDSREVSDVDFNSYDSMMLRFPNHICEFGTARLPLLIMNDCVNTNLHIHLRHVHAELSHATLAKVVYGATVNGCHAEIPLARQPYWISPTLPPAPVAGSFKCAAKVSLSSLNAFIGVESSRFLMSTPSSPGRGFAAAAAAATDPSVRTPDASKSVLGGFTVANVRFELRKRYVSASGKKRRAQESKKEENPSKRNPAESEEDLSGDDTPKASKKLDWGPVEKMNSNQATPAHVRPVASIPSSSANTHGDSAFTHGGDGPLQVTDAAEELAVSEIRPELTAGLVRVQTHISSAADVESAVQSLIQCGAAANAVQRRRVLRSPVIRSQVFDLVTDGCCYLDCTSNSMTIVDGCQFVFSDGKQWTALQGGAASFPAIVVCKDTYALFRNCRFVLPRGTPPGFPIIRCEDSSASFVLEQCVLVNERRRNEGHVSNASLGGTTGKPKDTSAVSTKQSRSPKVSFSAVVDEVSLNIAIHRPDYFALTAMERRVEIYAAVRNRSTRLQVRMDRSKVEGALDGPQTRPVVLCKRCGADVDFEFNASKKSLSLNVFISSDTWSLPVSFVQPLARIAKSMSKHAAAGASNASRAQLVRKYICPAPEPHHLLAPNSAEQTAEIEYPLKEWRVLLTVSPMEVHVCLPNLLPLVLVSLSNLSLWSAKEPKKDMTNFQLRMAVQQISVMECSSFQYGQLLEKPLQIAAQGDHNTSNKVSLQTSIAGSHLTMCDEHIVTLDVLARAVAEWPHKHTSLEIVNYCGHPVTITTSSGEGPRRVETRYASRQATAEDALLTFPFLLRLDGYDQTYYVAPPLAGSPQSPHHSSGVFGESTSNASFGSSSTIGGEGKIDYARQTGCHAVVILGDGNRLVVSSFFDFLSFTQRVTIRSDFFVVNSTPYNLILGRSQRTRVSSRSHSNAVERTSPTSLTQCTLPATTTSSVPISMMQLTGVSVTLVRDGINGALDASASFGDGSSTHGSGTPLLGRAQKRRVSEPVPIGDPTLGKLREQAILGGADPLGRLETFVFLPKHSRARRSKNDDSATGAAGTAEHSASQDFSGWISLAYPTNRTSRSFLNFTYTLEDSGVFVLHISPARQWIRNSLSLPVTLYLSQEVDPLTVLSRAGMGLSSTAESPTRGANTSASPTTKDKELNQLLQDIAKREVLSDDASSSSADEDEEGGRHDEQEKDSSEAAKAKGGNALESMSDAETSSIVAIPIDPMRVAHLDTFDPHKTLYCRAAVDTGDSMYISADVINMNSIESGDDEGSVIMWHALYNRRHVFELHLAASSDCDPLWLTSTNPSSERKKAEQARGVRTGARRGASARGRRKAGMFASATPAVPPLKCMVLSAPSMFRVCNRTGRDVTFLSEEGNSLGTLPGVPLQSLPLTYPLLSSCAANVQMPHPQPLNPSALAFTTPLRQSTSYHQQSESMGGNEELPALPLFSTACPTFAYLPEDIDMQVRAGTSMFSEAFSVKGGSGFSSAAGEGYMIICDVPELPKPDESPSRAGSGGDAVSLSSPKNVMPTTAREEVVECLYLRPIAERPGTDWREVVAAVKFVNESPHQTLVVRHIVRRPGSRAKLVEQFIVVPPSHQVPYSRLAKYGYSDYFSFAMDDASKYSGGQQLCGLQEESIQSKTALQGLCYSAEVNTGLSPNTDWTGWIDCGPTHHAVQIRKQNLWDTAIISVSAPRKPHLSVVNYTPYAFTGVGPYSVKRHTPESINEGRLVMSTTFGNNDKDSLVSLEASLVQTGVVAVSDSVSRKTVFFTTRVLPEGTVVLITEKVYSLDTIADASQLNLSAGNSFANRPDGSGGALRTASGGTTPVVTPARSSAADEEVMAAGAYDWCTGNASVAESTAKSKSPAVTVDVGIDTFSLVILHHREPLLAVNIGSAALWLVKGRDDKATVQFTVSDFVIANLVDVPSHPLVGRLGLPYSVFSPASSIPAKARKGKDAVRLNGVDATARDALFARGIFSAESIQFNLGRVQVDLTDRFVKRLIRFGTDCAVSHSHLIVADALSTAFPPPRCFSEADSDATFVTTRFDIEQLIIAEVVFILSWDRNGTGDDDLLGDGILSQLIPSLKQASLTIPTYRFSNLKYESPASLLGKIRKVIVLELIRQIHVVAGSVRFVGSATPFGSIISQVGNFFFRRSGSAGDNSSGIVQTSSSSSTLV